MQINVTTGQTKMSGEASVQQFSGTREELLAAADTIERNAARRGYSGVIDRATAADLRRLVAEAK